MLGDHRPVLHDRLVEIDQVAAGHAHEPPDPRVESAEQPGLERGVGVAKRGVRGIERGREAVAHDLGEQVVLGREVQIQPLAGQPGRARDLLHGSLAKAEAQERGKRDVQQVAPAEVVRIRDRCDLGHLG